MKNEQESFESSYTLLRKKVAEARKVVAAIACTSSENTTPHVVIRSGGRNDEVAEAASFVVFDKAWATPLLVVVDGDGDDVQVVGWGIREKGGQACQPSGRMSGHLARLLSILSTTKTTSKA